MTRRYDPTTFEPRWQKVWAEEGLSRGRIAALGVELRFDAR